MAAIKNRRRGPDTMVKMITAFSFFSWLLIIIAFLLYQTTHPAIGMYNTVRKSFVEFDTGIIIAKVMLLLNFLICLWGMAMNMMRNKRKSDRFRVSLIISAVISLAGFILMMVFL